MPKEVKKVIRSSPVEIKFANTGKLEIVASFLPEYRKIVQQVIDHAWSNGLNTGKYVFDVEQDFLDVPSFVPLSCLPVINTELSARAVKCASTQAMSMLRAAVKRRKKDLFWLANLLKNNEEVPEFLTERLARPLVKPNASGIKSELNSLCASIGWTSATSFDGWLTLSSLGKTFGKIIIPLKRHRHLNELASRGRQLPSVLLSESGVDIRFEMKVPPKTGTIVVGADSGMKTVLSLSDGQSTKDTDEHGHSLVGICESLAKKRNGSKAFEAKTRHRTNFINRSINELNWVGIGQINMEKIVNINYGRRMSRKMKSWVSTGIRDKVKRLGEDRNVSFLLQSSAYRSQRCSRCGNVRKANRQGKLYVCQHCGWVCDADTNAAMNHAVVLPFVPWAFLGMKLNLGDGFFWKPDGFFTLSGEELAVPPSLKKAVLQTDKY